MGERRGTKALELWCRRITEGYPGVNVQNMTTSWRDGLAFCAMIHHFRPDLIDFNSLNKDDVYGNNELAFRTAEKHLGIPALLDAEDMASCSVPDRLSILTYLSQFYQTFGGSSPSRLAMNRTTETADERIAPMPESPKQKVGSRLGMRRDPCAVCGLPVFLAEKLVIARTPYHRTCFRCARCNNQLTPGNYYETEEGQYCCETCPDEEATSTPMHQKYNQAIIAGDTSGRIGGQEDDALTGSSNQRSLSDEEKTGRRTAIDPYDPGKRHQDPAVPDLIAQTSQLRLSFMASHLLSERNEEASVVDGSLMAGDAREKNLRADLDGERTGRMMNSAFPDDDENDDREEEEEEEEEEDEDEDEEEDEEEVVEEVGSAAKVGGVGEDRVNDGVHSALDDSLDSKRNEEQRLTAISFHDVVKDKSVSLVNREDDTKELLGQVDERGDAGRCLSLVQQRLRMFEGQSSKDRVESNDKSHSRSIEVLESKVRAKERSVVDVQSDEDPGTDLGASETRELDDANSSAVGKVSPVEGNAEKSVDVIDVTEKVSKISTKNLNVEEGERSLDDARVTFARSTVVSPESMKNATTVDAKEESSKGETSIISGKENSLTTADGIDLSGKDDYPEDLNPFANDEDEEIVDECRTTMDSSKSSRISTNPFDSEDDEEDESKTTPPKPAARNNIHGNRTKQQADVDVPTKRVLAVPKIYLNPFWSDEEDHDGDSECREKTPGNMPIPKPRTIKHTPELGITHRKSNLNRSGMYASNSSIASSESTTTPGGTYRKKKPAPQPPAAKELFPSPGNHGASSRTMPRARKAKPAPPPPLPTSTPCRMTTGVPLNLNESPITESHDIIETLNMWEDQKTNKDEANRNRQSLTNISSGDNLGYKSYPDKSVQGKWKRKKGPAPPCPIPHKRKIRVSMKDVKLELEEIEMQQQGLEKQGVRLEQLIRDKCESGTRADVTDVSIGIDVEELVLELFALVNEKNELFRRQAELMLLRRQQRLEEEHAEVEYQIRCLMSQPEATKTDFDKQREETLIQRLVEIVERRNEIVECLEMDRRREVEEDRSIHKHMGLFAARNKNEILGNHNSDSNSSKTKKGKTKEKAKEKKSKKTPKKDADKDVDETEVKLKRHTKRKWF